MIGSKAWAVWFTAALLGKHHLNTDMRRCADTMTISTVLIQSAAESSNRSRSVKGWRHFFAEPITIRYFFGNMFIIYEA